MTKFMWEVVILFLILSFCCKNYALSSDHHNRTICFQSHDVNERGADVAIYDYADYNEKVLGYKSMILIPDKPKCRKGASLPKYIQRFGVNGVVFYEPDKIQLGNGKVSLVPGKNLPIDAKKAGCDLIHILKSGDKLGIPRYPDAFNNDLVPACVHAVFTYQKHAPNVPYAAISPSVVNNKPGRFIVPHIVRPPSDEYFTDKLQDLREELNISRKALVVCRHGGSDTFNVPFVFTTIYTAIEKYPNKDKLIFLFMGTNQFTRKGLLKNGETSNEQNPQIIHLPTNSQMQYKERFIKSCDVMLHARIDGETFGLAIAEFSVRNKPVLTFPGDNTEHIRLLGDKGFIYNNPTELLTHITHFIERGVDKTRDYNAYREFSPEIVMQQFKKVFMDPVFGVN